MGIPARLHRLLCRCFSASFVLKIWRGKCTDQADGVAELISVPRAPLSSSENHPRIKRGAKVAHAGSAQRFYNMDRVRSQEGNCDVVLAEAAKCQARDEGP